MLRCLPVAILIACNGADSAAPTDVPGKIYVTNAADGTFAYASASFTKSTGSCRRTIGPCEVAVYCTNENEQFVDYSAGVVTIAGGTEPVKLAPRADGTYEFYRGEGPLFAAGDEISARAPGAAVEGFMLGVTAAPQATITSRFDVVDASSDLAITWNGPDTGFIVVSFAEGIDWYTGFTCSLPAAGSMGVIPSSVLSELRGDAGRMRFASYSTVVGGSADSPVEFSVGSEAVWADGTPAVPGIVSIR